MGKITKERRVDKRKITASPKFESNDNVIILWSFEKIDRNGAFAFDTNRKDFDVEHFFKKILEFSTMKWCELFPSDDKKSRHHPLSPDSLSKQAKERIFFMNLEEETDSIYSLALTGKIRLIGIRKGSVFQAIWYDANHDFAHSKLKHT